MAPLQGSFQEIPPLLHMPSDHPEAFQRVSQAQSHLRSHARLVLSLGNQKAECLPQVLVFALQALEPTTLLWTLQRRLGLLCQRHIVGGMSPLDPFSLPSERESLPSIL